MTLQRIRITVLCCSLVFFVSCSKGKSDSPVNVNDVPLSKQVVEQTYVYECSDDYNFVARTEGENIWLFLPGQTIKLLPVPSASGAKYKLGNVMFWNKADEVLLEVATKKYSHCKNNRAKAIWENAKLNGVSFRAVGNEPGWYLEISKQDGILFVSDYGQTQNKFSLPAPVSNQNTRTTTFQVYENGHAFEVILKGEKCLDTMSDESFGTTVTVKLDNKKYNGCGRALH